MIGGFYHDNQSSEIRVRKVANGFLVTSEELVESPESRSMASLTGIIQAQMNHQKDPVLEGFDSDGSAGFVPPPPIQIRVPVERVYLSIEEVLSAIQAILKGK